VFSFADTAARSFHARNYITVTVALYALPTSFPHDLRVVRIALERCARYGCPQRLLVLLRCWLLRLKPLGRASRDRKAEDDDGELLHHGYHLSAAVGTQGRGNGVVVSHGFLPTS
jgi:hypothetical protein